MKPYPNRGLRESAAALAPGAAVLRAGQIRAAEQRAAEIGDADGHLLMERAAAGMFDRLRDRLAGLRAGGGRVCVMCGPGNNGGDGFVLARLLRGWGAEVTLLFAGARDRQPPEAARAHDRWLEAGGAVLPLTADAARAGSGGDLLIDAVFGTGLVRPVVGELGAVFAALAQGPVRALRVAVDVPSGLCADSGRFLGPAHRVDLTVSFHRSRPGHFLAEGGEACGALEIVDIGLPPAAVEDSGPPLRLARSGQAAGRAQGHKFAHGHALVLAGGPGRGGAARMAARGALRIGAGLVTLGCPPAAQLENAAQLNAVMLRRVGDDGALSGVLEDERINALCLGPGMGTGERSRALIAAALKARRATVLDADALGEFRADPQSLFAGLHERVVLTPHGGEFAALFPDLAERLRDRPTAGPAYAKTDAAADAARRAGCVVLFKGVDTVIAAPDGRIAINAALRERAVPWLATAGAGDVLSGFVTGLLARGLDPFDAAQEAAWLHVECARRFGPGLIAEDLPEALPGVLRRLAAGVPG